MMMLTYVRNLRKLLKQYETEVNTTLKVTLKKKLGITTNPRTMN